MSDGFTYTEGSVISFTPDHGWVAVFTDKDSSASWELPVTGWAVVCRFSVAEDNIRAEKEGTCDRNPAHPDNAIETHIEPVVLTEHFTAEPLSEYLHVTTDPYLSEPDHHHPHVEYKIIREEPA